MKAKILLALLLSSAYLAPTVFAGDVDYPDRINAKLARNKAAERLRQSSEDDVYKRGGGDSSQCGSTNVGNVTNERGARGPRDLTVIVTGDIINTNNKCR